MSDSEILVEATGKLKIKARPRVTSGVEGLDGLVSGGFQQNKCYLVAGEAGTGKTIFCLQYIMAGARQGESGVYVSIDEKPGHILEDAASLGWDLASLIEHKKVVLLDSTPYFTKVRLGKEKQIDVRTLVSDLTKYIREVQATRLVIDPIAPLVFAEDQTASVQEYIRSLIFSLEDNLKCTTLITTGIPAGSDRMCQYGVEEFVVSGIIRLDIAKVGERRLRTLYIRKMRGTPTDLNDHVFEIHPQRGIVIREAV